MAHSKIYRWHKVAAVEDELIFSTNNLVQVVVAEKNICIARGRDNLYACAPKCPHAGGVMADGFIDALNNIVCPLHRYKFSLKNGRNISGEGYHLVTYPVQKTEEGIFVGIDEGNIFSL